MVTSADVSNKIPRRRMFKFGANIKISREALALLLHLPEWLDIVNCEWDTKTDSITIKVKTESAPKVEREGLHVGRIPEGSEAPNVGASYMSYLRKNKFI